MDDELTRLVRTRYPALLRRESRPAGSDAVSEIHSSEIHASEVEARLREVLVERAADATATGDPVPAVAVRAHRLRRRRAMTAVTAAVATVAIAGGVLVARQHPAARQSAVPPAASPATPASTQMSPTPSETPRVTAGALPPEQARAITASLLADPAFVARYGATPHHGALFCGYAPLGSVTGGGELSAAMFCGEFAVVAGTLRSTSSSEDFVRLRLVTQGSETSVAAWAAPRGDRDWVPDVERLFPASVAAAVVAGQVDTSAAEESARAQARAAWHAGEITPAS